ncbi:MAG TPA: GGDEF domain-containing protein [Polyangia bacterium]|jgi:diguanylate cyclase (GGDEF)-like protein|nr:GGDEF domain-containing protein [Polyangia bacterium]
MSASPRRRSQTAVDSQTAAGRLLLRRLLRQHTLLLREVVELRALRDFAYHDPLTGLRNARYLGTRLHEELQREGTPAGALVVLDVEGFGSLNKRHGRKAGDRALVWLAGQLGTAVRASDICCRSGADEFALILPDTDRAGAEVTAFRLIQAAASARGERWLPLHLQVGIATWPGDAGDATSVVTLALRALAADRSRQRGAGARLRLVP